MKRPAPFPTRSHVGAWLFGALATLVSTFVQAAPQAGWWWNSAESGRGFFLEVQGPRMFMSGYFYADDGTATWLVSNDPMPGESSYDGRLLAFRDGQSLLGDYRHPAAATDAGGLSLRFSDDSHGTLAWPGGSVAIQRYDFHHGAAAAFQPRTGWWWNPDESGRGFSIEVQGDHMFIGAYMYDDAGKPVWYVADALMQSPTHFSAPLLLFANGQTMAGSYHAPTPPAFVGTITVDFSAPDQATVTLSDDLPPGAAKRGKVIVIKPQYVKPVAEKAIAKWVGSMDEVTTGVADGGVVITWHAEVVSMTWQIDDELVALGSAYPAFYKVAPGSFVVVNLSGTSPFCTMSAAGNADLSQGDLTIEKGGGYHGQVFQQVLVHGNETCTVDGDTVSINIDLPFPFTVVMSGQMDAGGLTGSNQTIVGGASLSSHWSFAPVQ
jgi:hypothetical protein